MGQKDIRYYEKPIQEAYLRSQSANFLSSITEANRAQLITRQALRVLPNFLVFDETDKEINLLIGLATCLTNATFAHTGVTSVGTLKASKSIASLQFSFTNTTDFTANAAFESAVISFLPTFPSTDRPEKSIEDTIYALKHSTNAQMYSNKKEENFVARALDILSIEKQENTFENKLWCDISLTADKSMTSRRLLEKLESSSVFHFWHRFYEGMWNGTFDEWDLALEVIQIDEAIWEKGVKGVAAEIEKIEARLELQARISELELAVLEEHSQQRGIGDNFPPEPIDDIAIVPSDLQPLWEPLLSIKAETHAEVPDVKRVQKAISVLIGIASACGSWAWEKANIFINAGLKTAGAATGTALLAHLAGHGDKIALVIDAALRWFGLLP